VADVRTFFLGISLKSNNIFYRHEFKSALQEVRMPATNGFSGMLIL
jgi:hypothetical protein